MKILIYGAGVVGTTYGWQLSKAGHDITVLVRSNKKQTVSENCIYLKEILPLLGKSAGKAHVLFFQNMWNDFDEIAKHLSPEQYFFGFPFMAGGGRNDNSIYVSISGLKYSHTPLGELNGTSTDRIQKMAKALEKANLKPIISKQIKIWLITHYAIAGGLSAGIIKAGGAETFSGNSKIVKETIKAIREGLKVCSTRGIDPKSEKANKLYYLPLFISIPIAKKVYANEALRLMFDGHTQHSPDEMKKMLQDIIDSGEQQHLKMNYLKKLQENCNNILKSQS